MNVGGVPQALKICHLLFFKGVAPRARPKQFAHYAEHKISDHRILNEKFDDRKILGTKSTGSRKFLVLFMAQKSKGLSTTERRSQITLRVELIRPNECHWPSVFC